jgi:hypothetical protein
MNSMYPSIPLPGPLRGAESGSFAHHTVADRLPGIAQRTLAENDFPPAARTALQALIQEIPDGTIRTLLDRIAPDITDWEGYVAPYHGQTWLQVPWFFAEAYFYRRILEATGYFSPGPGQGVDPFAYQKRQGLSSTQEAIHALSDRLDSWLQQGPGEDGALVALLAVDLWGNQADLSLWPAAHDGQPNHVQGSQGDEHILINDARAVAGYLSDLAARPVRLDFLVDNAAFELVGDLCLADYLLACDLATRIHLHLKAHPTFVSDAMPIDVEQTVGYLEDSAHPSTHDLGRRLRHHLDQQRLYLRSDLFWTSPLSMWQMPDPLRQELDQSQLVISKGDAHYRRLLGDRHWPYTTPLADIVAGFPAPLLALRTLKSEVATGLTQEQIQRLDQEDSEWLTDGHWGVIQFILAA